MGFVRLTKSSPLSYAPRNCFNVCIAYWDIQIVLHIWKWGGGDAAGELLAVYQEVMNKLVLSHRAWQ